MAQKLIKVTQNFGFVHTEINDRSAKKNKSVPGLDKPERVVLFALFGPYCSSSCLSK